MQLPKKTKWFFQSMASGSHKGNMFTKGKLTLVEITKMIKVKFPLLRDSKALSWVSPLHFTVMKANNSQNGSFIISWHCEFDAYHSVWYQIFVFHFHMFLFLIKKLNLSFCWVDNMMITWSVTITSYLRALKSWNRGPLTFEILGGLSFSGFQPFLRVFTRHSSLIKKIILSHSHHWEGMILPSVLQFWQRLLAVINFLQTSISFKTFILRSQTIFISTSDNVISHLLKLSMRDRPFVNVADFCSHPWSPNTILASYLQSVGIRAFKKRRHTAVYVIIHSFFHFLHNIRKHLTEVISLLRISCDVVKGNI